MIKRNTLEQFITRSIKIHNNKYDYSKVNFVDGTVKVCIICPEHGEFWQTPQDHLAGKGCAKCAGRLFSTTDFIKKASFVHNNKYDYSKTNYTRGVELVCIICPIHGKFWQQASVHIHGHGCPKCAQTNASKGETEIINFLTSLHIEFIAQYQIVCPINNSGFAKIDFYLPKYSIFIEYNGRQHYEPVEYFGGLERFNKQQARDQYLRIYCIQHNIELIEISYKETNYLEILKLRLIKD